MTFFDTNVLIYAIINQDSNKQKLAEKFIEAAIANVCVGETRTASRTQ